ncbi:DUF4198 domain-containing protein [Gimesia fumaroli]|uniref:Carboxypeptidase regulatory-like domain-containing protein n=1 Tax=Gimesia fumaroli TaxID=2527976 RepID=A0A518I9Z8_9PLAN|nr:DUF4198 domain-containing protein [Gimesia fumaroli]QDV49839.1 hypothetical protein Enr17x_18600 [Gimesia fumaroli]
MNRSFWNQRVSLSCSLCSSLLTKTIYAGIVVLMMLVGCGQEQPTYDLVAVTGKVLLDGKPVENIRVEFDSPVGARAFGMTDKDGAYQLETPEYGEGAPAGDYLVRVRRSKQTAPSLVIPLAYDDNGVERVTVSNDQGALNEYVFDLKSKPDQADLLKTNEGEQ